MAGAVGGVGDETAAVALDMHHLGVLDDARADALRCAREGGTGQAGIGVAVVR